MKKPPLRLFVQLALTLALLLMGSEATASTITQNSSWTINGKSSTTYSVVAYGDSIFAGYHGSLSSVARRAAPWVQGEYLSNSWGTSIQVIRRTKSGALASDIYDNKIIAEKSYMQASNVRVVTFEMCGNDFLQARSSFTGQSGTCDLSVIQSALDTCTTYQEKAMQAINQYATSAKTKIIMNLYYPGYNGDNVQTSCTDAGGNTLNEQNTFLPYLARSNYRACSLAAKYGFQCVDAFANFMGADYDSNGDGLVDSDALRWSASETEDQYVTRISQTLRATLRDAGTHFTNASTSFDYLQSDNTHPTYSGDTIYVGFFGGTGSGSGSPDYSGSQIQNGKNPIYNQFGHERAGWAHALFNPSAP